MPVYSASQGAKVLRCASKWSWEYVYGFKPEPNQPMLDGTEIHAFLQYWIAYGLTIPPGRNGDAARALAKHLPPPGSVPPEAVEARFVTKLGPHTVRGIVDLITFEAGRLVIGDHKTRSDLKWALAVAELTVDFQIRLYALIVVRLIGWPGDVVVRHNNVVRSPPHRTRIVETTIQAHEFAEIEAHVLRTFGYMDALRLLPIEHVPYNRQACDDYKSPWTNPDGCPHRARCAAMGRRVGGNPMYYLNVRKPA